MTTILNTRQLILALIAATQIFSPVLFVPGAENIGGSVFRLVLILTAGVLALKEGFRPISFWPRRALSAGMLLAAWMMISLMWTPDLQAGIKQIIYLAAVLMLIYVLDALIRSKHELIMFARTIWILGIVVSLLAFYELRSGNHFFRSAMQNVAESDRSLNYISENQAWFTFGNPNDLSVHIILSCFISGLLFGRSIPRNILVFGFWVFAIYLAIELDARITLVALAAFAGVGCIALLQRKTSATALFVGMTILVGAGTLVFGLIFIDRAEFLDVSTFVRLKLVASAAEMASQTFFLGIGSGGFESEMWFGGFIGSTYGIVNPHNGIGRILAENGILGLSLFGFLLFGPVIALGRSVRTTQLSAFVAGMMLGLPLLFSVGSDPLSASSLQLAIALLWVACRFAVQQEDNLATATSDVGSPVFKSVHAGKSLP